MQDFIILSECRDSNPESPGPKPGMLAVTPHSDMFHKEILLSTLSMYTNIFFKKCMYTNVMKPQTGEVWKHYKTKGEYEIIGIGQMQTKIESLDMKECVIYKSSAGTLWSRPLADFIETLTNEKGETVPRFRKVS